MKSNYLLWLAVIISIALSIFALVEVRNTKPDLVDIKCRAEKDRCINKCQRTLDNASSAARDDSSSAAVNHQIRLFDCRIRFVGNPNGLLQCENEENARFDAELSQIANAGEAARSVFEACEDDCDTEEKKCRKEGFKLPSPEIDIPVVVECIESGSFICRKPVDEICKMIAGVCDDCWRTLCPGAAWKFSSDRQMTVTLIAAADPAKDARTLATSVSGTARVALPVPEKIELQQNEKLWLQFEMSEKPSAGSVKITVHYEN